MKEFRKIQQVNQTKKSTNETTTYCGHIFEAKPHVHLLCMPGWRHLDFIEIRITYMKNYEC